jgi:hypothetical protein
MKEGNPFLIISTDVTQNGDLFCIELVPEIGLKAV